MFRLKENIHVNAPIERCFLLSTSIALVQQTIGLKPVQGKTSGLIVGGDQLIWRGWKFGLPAMHETLITAYDRPNFFQDTMGRGRFKHFQHDHQFTDIDGQTLMIDIVRFSMPFGPLGKVIGKHIVVPHVLSLMLRRFQLLKRIAEGPDWERYLATADDPASATRVAKELNRIQQPG
jgi:ligand-binding SRPBCC domain-containing protein